MNKIIPIILIVLAIQSCNSKPEFTIEGRITGDDDISYVILIDDKQLMDTINVENQQFNYRGFVDTVHLAYLKSPVNGKKMEFILEPGIINIEWDGNKNLRSYGTVNNDAYEMYKHRMDSTTDIVMELYQDYLHEETQEGKDNAMEEYNMAEENRLAVLRSLLRQNPNYTGLMILKPIYKTDSLGNLKGYLDLLSEFNYTDIYKEVDQYYNAVMNTSPGMPVPSFTLEDSHGNNIDIESYKGKYILLDFWFTGCSYCDRLIPHFREIYSELQYKDFEIIGISVDSDRSVWLNTVQHKKTPWIQLHDINKEVAVKFGMAGYPTLILVDKQGNVAKRLVGYRDKQTLMEEINDVFKISI